jgi:hypothetical protein
LCDLAIVNSAAMNMFVQVFYDFSSDL